VSLGLPGLRIGTGPGAALPLTAVNTKRAEPASVERVSNNSTKSTDAPQVSTTPIYDMLDGER